MNLFENIKNHLKVYLIIIAFLILLVISYLIYVNNSDSVQASNIILDDIIDQVVENIPSIPDEVKTIKVDIKGYVANTGVYEVIDGSRVIDVVNAAGGFIEGYKFIFMGDAGKKKEKDILDKYNISNIDVLKVGHHGSKTSGETFISKMNPKYSLISVGKNNRYGHPNKEVLDNLRDSKIYRTDDNGSIMFKIKNNKLYIETCTP